ncbi:hypothetical protein HPB52_012114 [Rhipicephalus sanguineus]|uniref:Uncharacterized protein n=1 Tax=Rhipicephalus sanguineus TaxID=34632 RepID=A0A9D4Q6E3_RHISA|nr:hypothetical protein HPB52_012114 [Rhipicephalus sanguineus]
MSLYWCTSDEVKPPHTALHLLLTHSHLKLRCLEMTGQTFNGKLLSWCSSNSGLVEKVQELASIDENESVSRIEGSLKSFTELDDFMCLAGVVEYGVCCCRYDDGSKQLDDLTCGCWLHSRLYLKMVDILDPK